MTPHAILGVSPGANLDDIRAAYVKLVKRYHPDVNSTPAARGPVAGRAETGRI